MAEEEFVKMRRKKKYYSQRTIISIIKKVGTIEEIVVSKEKILMLLSYREARIILEFVYQLNSALKNNELTESNLELLRSDWLVTQIINLDKIVKELKGRNLEECEIRDKLNTLTLIKDEQIILNIFANPILINEINRNPYDYNLTDWIKSGYIHNISIITEMKIIEAFKSNGAYIIGYRMMYSLLMHEQHMKDVSEGGEIYNKILELVNTATKEGVNELNDSKRKIRTLYE